MLLLLTHAELLDLLESTRKEAFTNGKLAGRLEAEQTQTASDTIGHYGRIRGNPAPVSSSFRGVLSGQAKTYWTDTTHDDHRAAADAADAKQSASLRTDPVDRAFLRDGY